MAAAAAAASVTCSLVRYRSCSVPKNPGPKMTEEQEVCGDDEVAVEEEEVAVMAGPDASFEPQKYGSAWKFHPAAA